MPLRVYNYLNRQRELFKPLIQAQVGIYVCGPTVYDHMHLGHAKTYVTMDVMIRYLKHLGYTVRYVRNLTDMEHRLDSGENRITKRARRKRIAPMEVVEKGIHSFNNDMDALGVLRPHISPRSTCHVPEIITWVQDLIDKGFAYEVEGNVYFSVRKFSKYGALSNRKLDDLCNDARVDRRADKQDPADFALWKRAAPNHWMRWPSPWGAGYPGGHIACAVMSTKYLGQTFDIHGGGLENIFPHNERESASAEARHGVGYAKYWLLVGALTVNGVKMSRSLGNFLTLKDALQLYTPEALRYFLLSSHYRKPLNYSHEALEKAQQSVNWMGNTLHKLHRRMRTATPAGTAVLSQIVTLNDYRQDFFTALNDDFNTAKALEILLDFVKAVNQYLDKNQSVSMGTLAAMERIFNKLAGEVLGVLPQSLVRQLRESNIEGLLDLLLELRQEYRVERDWAKANLIRNRLSTLGLVVEDDAAGSVWYLQ